MGAFTEQARIALHEPVGPGYRFLVAEAPRLAAALVPGQFVHVRVPALEASALRRPFSVFDADDGRVTILYKEVGRGTAALAKSEVGDTLDILGPLGHGFPVACRGAAFLVGGGYGVAPRHFLAKRLIAADPSAKPVLFLGGRTKDDLLALDEFAALGVEVRVATNDGSAGAKGFVTDPLDDALIEQRGKGLPFELFTCGPDGLLKAVAQRALDAKAPGWISMDRHMICGVGACYACVQKTVRGYSRCCIEGPVFRAEDLIFD